MFDNPVSRSQGRLPRALSLRYAAVQHILGVVMASNRDEEGRPVPAKVYPLSAAAQEWVVEPPSLDGPTRSEPKTFSGSAALPRALEYAHRTYGGALYLSR